MRAEDIGASALAIPGAAPPTVAPGKFWRKNQNRKTSPVEYRKLFQFTWPDVDGIRVKK